MRSEDARLKDALARFEQACKDLLAVMDGDRAELAERLAAAERALQDAQEALAAATLRNGQAAN